MIGDSFLSDAGWIFFAALSVVVCAVGIAAFGRDVISSKAPIDPAAKAHHANPVHPDR